MAVERVHRYVDRTGQVTRGILLGRTHVEHRHQSELGPFQQFLGRDRFQVVAGRDIHAQQLLDLGPETRIAGAGFGVAGYDWTSEHDPTAAVIERLELGTPYKFVNDTVIGLVAGSQEGWGVVVVSGTGSNCRGWDREHVREGRVSGHGVMMGEGAGASELMFRCMQLVGYAWSKRGLQTKLAELRVWFAAGSLHPTLLPKEH